VNRDLRVWHPWLRINRVLRVMLQTRWSAEAWSQVRVDRVWMTGSYGAVLVHFAAFS